MLEILLALIAGVLTIAAPCILLPLPILLGSSVGQQNKARPLFITMGFVLTFAVLGISLNFLVQNLGLDPNLLRNIAVFMLAVFALFMIWPTPFERVTAHFSGLITKASQTGQAAGTGNWGGFVMGVVIGIVWAPCAGPILGSILTLIAQEKDTLKAFGLLTAYSVGAGLPMLAISYGGQTITTKVRFVAKYSTRLQQLFGVILLALAASIYFQYDTKLQSYLVTKLPVLGTGLEEKLANKLDSSNDSESRQNPSNASGKVTLKDYGPAPEFTGLAGWLNTDQPLNLKNLRGKVVLVDFWTYSCINCIRTLPYVTNWYNTYKDQGFVVVGMHTPEFAFEKDADNIRRALKQHGITYPIAMDNDFGTWNAYQNRYWPAHYLIDQEGRIVHYHFGEGKYAEMETAIRQLLGLSGEVATIKEEKPSGAKSPEMYFGTKRLGNLLKSQTSLTGSETLYSIPHTSLPKDTFALEGEWKFYPEYAVLAEGSEGEGKIKLRFHAKQVHMVAGSKTEPLKLRILVDGVEQPGVTVDQTQLYTLFRSEESKDRVIEIIIPSQANFQVFTFTFG